MTEEATVSIVVPVRNGAATIAACLRSLLVLDWPAGRRELIVVDNASSDDTLGVLERFGDLVHVVREPRRGSAAARNAGIRNAKGARIAFTDADCVVDPGWLRHLLLPLDDPTVGIAGGRILALRPCNRVQLFGEKIHDHRRAIEKLDPPYAITMNWASRRAVLEESGLFNETLLRGSDVELAVLIRAGGHRLVYCHEAVVFHRNEATLYGLFNEGRDHGRASEMVRAMGRHAMFLAPGRRFPTLGRIVRSARQAVTGPERFTALCAMVFDLGKATGRASTRLALTRSRRHP